MLPFLALAVAGIVFFLSRRVLKAPVPDTQWRLFHLPAAQPLSNEAGQRLQGVYRVKHGNDFTGDVAVLKWTALAENGEKKYYLSIYFQKGAGYFICEAKRLREKILINGYWAKHESSETGKARFIINRLLHGMPLRRKKTTIKGRISNGNNFPKKRITLQFEKPLPPINNFYILAHRGAGRNIDFYPASENSIEMIRLGTLLGATGVEVDVQITADNIPVLFHDGILSYRSLDDYYLVEPIQSYTLQQLKTLKLKKGEKIPTLKEALDVILHQTMLELVWLDVKYTANQQPIVALQKEYLKKAKHANRKLEIYIGIPDADVLQCFKELPNYKNIPSLTELSKEIAKEINSKIWAPKWSEKTPDEEINVMHASGRKVFTWTVDQPELIEKFLKQYRYDGIVTNVPALLAFKYYTQ